jgi:23S rRNA pseudouridine2604 synthase
MADRPKLTVKTRAPERDPYRRPVRALTAPRPGPGNVRDAPPPAAQPAASANAPRPAGPRARTPPAPAAPAPAPAPAPEGVRVSKLVTERGLASRREADEWIEAGYVRVGGRAVVLGQRVAPDALIDIDARARATQARLVTVLLHKPMGYVSGQPEDGHEPAVMLVKPAHRWSGDASRIDYHPGHLRHLAPAGRLDIDSTGLLVFTQDGRIAKLLVGDQTRAEKEYLVRVRHLRPGPFPEEGVARLRHGLELDGVALRPARVSWQNEEQLRIVLREGRKRQIRRMCELVGLEVLGLKRVRIGSVALGPLPVGQWRYLREDERF